VVVVVVVVEVVVAVGRRTVVNQDGSIRVVLVITYT
jgi:hypothetical protein